MAQQKVIMNLIQKFIIRHKRVNKNKQVIFLYIALCCLFCDQLAKILIDNGYNLKEIQGFNNMVRKP